LSEVGGWLQQKAVAGAKSRNTRYSVLPPCGCGGCLPHHLLEPVSRESRATASRLVMKPKCRLNMGATVPGPGMMPAGLALEGTHKPQPIPRLEYGFTLQQSSQSICIIAACITGQLPVGCFDSILLQTASALPQSDVVYCSAPDPGWCQHVEHRRTITLQHAPAIRVLGKPAGTTAQWGSTLVHCAPTVRHCHGMHCSDAARQLRHCQMLASAVALLQGMSETVC
jgi:hypothetical protein